MLLELIFTVILNNITHARTHGRTHEIPSSRAPVGAKKIFPKKTNHFTFYKEKEVLTFTEATLIAPLILIAFLYLPTIIYVTKISINFYGWKNWMTSILNDPVYFIFPILTSMSFYGKPKSPQNDDKGRNEDVINMNTETFESVEETGNEPARQMNFSVRQSNILYILFIFGFILCIGADVLHQYTRKNKETNYLSSTSLTFCFFIFPCVLMQHICSYTKYESKDE